MAVVVAERLIFIPQDLAGQGAVALVTQDKVGLAQMELLIQVVEQEVHITLEQTEVPAL